MNYFSQNIKLLRKQKKITQDEMQQHIGIQRSTISNHENGITEPALEDLLKYSKFFGISTDHLLLKDFTKEGNLITEDTNIENGNANGNHSGNAIVKIQEKQHYKNDFKLSIIVDPAEAYRNNNLPVPITDLSVAAGITGALNSEYTNNLEYVSLPRNFFRRDRTTLFVRVKGPSMAPTMQDSSLCAIQLLNRDEWAKMPNEQVYVVSDMQGQAYLKRVKNRFKQGFITLKSDNPDKVSFPNFNLEVDEINTIWHVELNINWRFPNIHDQYYNKLQALEERLDDFELEIRKKLK